MERLGDAGLQGLLVSSLANLRYLTGFTGSAGLAAVVGHDTILIADSRYSKQARQETGGAIRVEIVDVRQWSRLAEILKQYRSLERLGFEAHVLTAEQVTSLQALDVGGSLRPISGLVEELRTKKEPSEVDAIRCAADIASTALEASIGALQEGARELEVAACLERELRLRGSEWHPFPTIVASGPRSALPHARTSGREIQGGDLVLLDFGAQIDGYCADISRTFVVGRRADERQRAVYGVVEGAQRLAREGLRAGVTGEEGDALARGHITDHGLGDAFVHSLGHGLGLEVHEAPRVSRANRDPLPDGAVITVEPGVYIEGWGGIRIEDDVVLRTSGVELVSDGRTELREIV